MGFFGKTNRRSAIEGPAYDPRLFLTTDARQQAFDDFCVATMVPYGLTPVQMIQATEMPRGFDYLMNVIGLGGTPAPSPPAQPLVNLPQYAATYLSESL